MDIGSSNASFLIGSYSRSLHLASQKLALTYLVTSSPPPVQGDPPFGPNMAYVHVAIETKQVVDLLEKLSIGDVLVLYDSMEGLSRDGDDDDANDDDDDDNDNEDDNFHGDSEQIYFYSNNYY